MDERIKSIIVDKLAVDENLVVNEAEFNKDLGADSLDIIELIMAFEDAFNITIPDEDLYKIVSISDALFYIENKQNNNL
ncbi:MAG: acyl carrier protein [Flavobacteriales bacterium]|nr:acyl carrier protein [Flavobacteriales bacterium]